MIAVLLVLNAWYVWSTGTRLEQRFRSLREAGEPVQLADLERMPIPPETNAATYLRRAADDLDSMQKELTAWYPQSAYPAVPVPPGDREKIGKLLAAYPKVWPLLEQAAACPDYDPEIDYTVGSLVNRKLDELNRHRSAFRVMRARSALAGIAGPRRRSDSDDARDAAIVAAFAARAVADRLSGCRGVWRHGDAGRQRSPAIRAGFARVP